MGLIFDLLPSIERGFKDFESTKFRPLLILCSLIIKDKDSDEEVLKNLSDILEKMLAINEKYFLESNLLLQWIIQVFIQLFSLLTAMSYFGSASQKIKRQSIAYWPGLTNTKSLRLTWSKNTYSN